MKRTLGALAMGIAVMGLLTCGGEDPEPVLKELTHKYWDAVLEQRMDEAYAMLSAGSRAGVSLGEFAESMTFVSLEGEEADVLKQVFAEKARLTILGIEVDKKEATVIVILLVPALGTLQSSLDAQLASGEPQVEDTLAWMAGEMIAAIEENRLPTQELRLKMTWILEGKRWGFAFGQG
jgi:hypothetical protein